MLHLDYIKKNTLDRSVEGLLVYICTGQFYLKVISDQSKKGAIS